MNKRLIYYSIGGHIEYIDILKIHLQSMHKFIDMNFDLLFITNESFVEKIKDLINKLKLNIDSVYFLIENTSSVKQSSASKLKIYNWEHIDKYDKIFYCDIDTIWTNNISDIFNTINNPDKIYTSNEEGLMGHCYYNGKDFFSEEQLNNIKLKNIKPINFGAFGFFSKNSYIFKKIEQFMFDNMSKMNACIEQPYANYILYINELINNDLNNFISHDHKTKKTLMHFPGGPGNFRDKIHKMKDYL